MGTAIGARPGLPDHLIVVVDDGGGLLDLPDDQRVVAVQLAHNYGCLGMVRNVGIRLTESRVLSFLDDGNNTRCSDHLRRSLVLRLSRRGCVAHIPHPTVPYLVNPASHYTQWTAS